MEKEGIVSFNSPVIKTNTPIKRLGLSRKRKSCGFECKLNSKIRAHHGSSAPGPDHPEKYLTEKEMETDKKDSDSKVSDAALNYDEEIDSLSKRIAEDEEKLKALQNVKNNIVQLEGLIELWKNGCKSALLYFIDLIKERQSEEDLKSILNRLGVWEIIVENFGSDQDIPLTDYSQ